MDLANYKLPEIKDDGINNEYKSLLSELLNPLNESRQQAGLRKLSATAFTKMVVRKYGNAKTGTLRELKRQAETFDVFTKGITHLLKK